MSETKTEIIGAVNYVEIFQFKTSYCDACGNLVQAQDVILCHDQDELIRRAERAHNDAIAGAHKVCLSPRLLITKDAVLVTAQTIAELEAQDKNNG